MSTSTPNTADARHQEGVASTVWSAMGQARSRRRAVRPRDRSSRARRRAQDSLLIRSAAALSPASREAEVAGAVPYRRQRGTRSEQETARDRNDSMPRQLIGSDRLTHAVPYHYAAAVTGVTFVFSAGAPPSRW